MRAIMIALLAGAATMPVERCYGYEDHLVLMPDRSGKLVLVISEKTQDTTLDKVKAALLGIVSDCDGFAAFTTPTLEIKDGWAIVRFIIYFEDINRFYYVKGRTHDNERTAEAQHESCHHFSLLPPLGRNDNFTLHIDDWLFGKMPKIGGPGVELPGWAETKKESENVVIRAITVPGKISRLIRFQRSEGRRAIFERSPKTILKYEDSIEYPMTGFRRVLYTASEVIEAESSAFRKELESAKSAWPKIKDELEQAAKKK